MKQIPQKAQKWKVRNHKGDFRLLLLIAPSAKRVKQSHAGKRILICREKKPMNKAHPYNARSMILNQARVYN
jgi:hypothetical protein